MRTEGIFDPGSVCIMLKIPRQLKTEEFWANSLSALAKWYECSPSVHQMYTHTHFRQPEMVRIDSSMLWLKAFPKRVHTGLSKPEKNYRV